MVLNLAVFFLVLLQTSTEWFQQLLLLTGCSVGDESACMSCFSETNYICFGMCSLFFSFPCVYMIADFPRWMQVFKEAKLWDYVCEKFVIILNNFILFNLNYFTVHSLLTHFMNLGSWT